MFAYVFFLSVESFFKLVSNRRDEQMLLGGCDLQLVFFSWKISRFPPLAKELNHGIFLSGLPSCFIKSALSAAVLLNQEEKSSSTTR